PAAFFGARIACSVLPSWRGRNSTMPFSPMSLIRRSRISRPRLVRVISRPRKKMVALTLSPSSRKRSTWFFSVSSPCSPPPLPPLPPFPPPPPSRLLASPPPSPPPHPHP